VADHLVFTITDSPSPSSVRSSVHSSVLHPRRHDDTALLYFSSSLFLQLILFLQVVWNYGSFVLLII
jgi:hypothetical protein